MVRVFLLLFAISLFGACSSDTSDGGSSSATSGAKKVFVYNQINSITSLDPAFAKSQNNIWGVDHLFNGLVRLDEQLNIQPAIAKSWEISEDGKTYTFKLRDDVFFHDHSLFEGGKGRKVVAQDVVNSFNRIIDKKINSPGSWLFKGKVANNAFTATDDYTFVMKLNEAFRPMLGILTMQYCSIIPQEIVDKLGKEFRNNPVGTGPFKFKKWIEGQALFLTKNENYFESVPKVDAVKVEFMSDRKTAFLEMMKGKIDFMSGLESSIANELLTPTGELNPAKKDQLQLLKAPYLNTEYLGINLKQNATNPLMKKKVRQALNYGFDRAQMLKTLRNNIGKPADAGFTPRGLPSYSTSATPGYHYNPDKARQLLKEAGYPNGKGLPEIELLTNKDYLDLCTFITRQWEDLGVKVKIELMESATLRQQMTKGNADFFRASWIADYPDAESFFTVFYSKNPAPPRYTRFENAKFDQLYEQALQENDDAKRHDLYHQMDRILIEEAPVIFLFYDETALFVQKDVSGISKNAINLLDLRKVEK